MEDTAYGAHLSDLFGIHVEGKRPEQLLQYFAVVPDTPMGKGIVQRSLQYYGEATN